MNDCIDFINLISECNTNFYNIVHLPAKLDTNNISSIDVTNHNYITRKAYINKRKFDNSSQLDSSKRSCTQLTPKTSTSDLTKARCTTLSAEELVKKRRITMTDLYNNKQIQKLPSLTREEKKKV